MPISEILSTISNPIPEWKGTVENNIPTILTISGDAPAISGAIETLIDFNCAKTYAKDGGIINSTKTIGTIFDDQQ